MASASRRVGEVAGSNPVAPTSPSELYQLGGPFYYRSFTRMTPRRLHLTIRRFCASVAVILLSMMSIHCSTYTEPQLPNDSCQTLIDNFEAARNTYTNDPSNRDKCIAAKTAGTALLECPSLSTSDKENYKDVIDGIYCN
jgi:hypothetical protein